MPSEFACGDRERRERCSAQRGTDGRKTNHRSPRGEVSEPREGWLCGEECRSRAKFCEAAVVAGRGERAAHDRAAWSPSHTPSARAARVAEKQCKDRNGAFMQASPIRRGQADAPIPGIAGASVPDPVPASSPWGRRERRGWMPSTAHTFPWTSTPSGPAETPSAPAPISSSCPSSRGHPQRPPIRGLRRPSSWLMIKPAETPPHSTDGSQGHQARAASSLRAREERDGTFLITRRAKSAELTALDTHGSRPMPALPRVSPPHFSDILENQHCGESHAAAF